MDYRKFIDLGAKYGIAPYWLRKRTSSGYGYVHRSWCSAKTRRELDRLGIEHTISYANSISDHYREIAIRFVRAKGGRLDGKRARINIEEPVFGTSDVDLVCALVVSREKAKGIVVHHSTERAIRHWSESGQNIVFAGGKFMSVPYAKKEAVMNLVGAAERIGH